MSLYCVLLLLELDNRLFQKAGGDRWYLGHRPKELSLNLVLAAGKDVDAATRTYVALLSGLTEPPWLGACRRHSPFPFPATKLQALFNPLDRL